jgi:anti-sigma factor RsiW
MADPSGEFQHDYTCQEVVALASEFLDGTMTADQMTAFELHLNFCDGCTSFVEQVRATVATAQRLSPDEIPEEMKAKLLGAFKGWQR